MPLASRRRFLSAFGATIGVAGLSGCVSGRLPGSGRSVDRTVFVGTYHWGFILLDERGEEHDQIPLDRGTVLRLVAFNTGAEQALETLPESVRTAVPGHHELEERNEGRVPAPSDGDLHESLEEANEQYPDHSVAVMPSGRNHMRGGMGSGMMLHPVGLPHDATRPATATLSASQRGDYTLSCLAYCGHGHAYMDLDGAFLVQ